MAEAPEKAVSSCCEASDTTFATEPLSIAQPIIAPKTVAIAAGMVETAIIKPAAFFFPEPSDSITPTFFLCRITNSAM